MTGGYWEIQNKIRPGAYINFETNDPITTGLSTTGPVVIPLALNWGEVGKFIKVSPDSKFIELFGKQVKDIIPIREAFKATGQVIVYNLNGVGANAKATSGTFIVTALHGGTDGNKINVTVTSGINESSTVKTFYEGSQVDSQVVANTADLNPNAFVSFDGDLPASDETLTLTGGTTIAATNEAFSDLVLGLDTQDFKVLAVGTDDVSVKLMLTLKVKEWRENNGKNVTLVTNNYKDADFEGVVSVLNGVTLEGNEVLPAKQSLYFYAGAYANAGANSLTYVAYPGAIDCERKTHDEIVQALKDGHIVYTSNNEQIVIEQDINTLRSFTVKKNKDFKKNKIIREMDILANNTKLIYSRFFIGKVSNNGNGRNLFKGQLMKEVMDPLVQVEAIETYNPDEIVIDQGDQKDAVLVTMGVVFNDAMEKLYMTVACK